jgi:hypothetical protein
MIDTIHYPILSPTAPGHSATLIDYLDAEGERTRIECECGWHEDTLGFDSGAIAQCAYEDHLKESRVAA